MGVGGFFRNRIKYLKTKRDEFDIPDISAQLDEMQLSPEEDLQFLQSCVIKNTDQAVVIAKLKSTQKLRSSMLRDPNIDLRAAFPFFFSNPELVSLKLNFTARLSHTVETETETNTFISYGSNGYWIEQLGELKPNSVALQRIHFQFAKLTLSNSHWFHKK